MTDWQKIQQEYIESDISLSKLADKHGVNRNTIRHHARREKWYSKRVQACARAEEIMIEDAATFRARVSALMDTAAIETLDYIISTLEQYKDVCCTRITQAYDGSAVIFDLNEIVEALVNVARLYGLDAASQLERERLKQEKAPDYLPGPQIIIETRSDRDLSDFTS